MFRGRRGKGGEAARVILAFESTKDRDGACRAFDGVAGSDKRLGLVVIFDKRLRGGRLAWAPEAWGRASMAVRQTGGYLQDAP